LNVALIAPRFPPCYDGAGDHAEHIAEALTAGGNRVLVLTEGDERRHAAPYEVRSVGQSWNARAIRKASGWVFALPASAILIEYTPFNFGARSMAPLALSYAARIRDVPVGTFAHEVFYPPGAAVVRGRAKSRLLAIRDRMVLSNSTAVFVADDEHRRRIVTRCPALGPRVFVVPIGANIEPRAAAACKPDHAAARRRVLAFGVVMPRRRIELLVRALAKLVERGIDAELLVVGRIFDAGYAARCDALARELGLQDRVQLCGALPAADVSAAMQTAHAAVHAAEQGAVASSGALLAVLAHAVPTVVVSTPFDDRAFFECAIFARPEPAAIADALAGILSDRARAAALGSLGQTLYERRFRWERSAGAALAHLAREERFARAAGY